MPTKFYPHYDDSIKLEGYASWEKEGKLPLILIFPAWAGRDAFTLKKADMLAKLGYLGFAADLYGNGKVGKTKEENSKLMEPFMKDRFLLQKRMLAILEYAKTLPEADPNRVGAIGFCFGGLCALDLARSGAAVQGVVSFHGLLRGFEEEPKEIKTKVLALHGYEDPMVPPTEVLAFAKEMSKAKADWQIHAYGKTLHAFTNPEANDPSFGTVYNATAEKRSLQAMKDFFAEIF